MLLFAVLLNIFWSFISDIIFHIFGHLFLLFTWENILVSKKFVTFDKDAEEEVKVNCPNVKTFIHFGITNFQPINKRHQRNKDALT